METKDIGDLFAGKLKELPDTRKQEILGDLMKARLTVLKTQAKKAAEMGAPEPKKPELAFDPVKPSGKFSLLFDKGLAGLDLI